MHFGYGREKREQRIENREENGGRKKVIGGVGRKRTSHPTGDCVRSKSEAYFLILWLKNVG